MADAEAKVSKRLREITECPVCLSEFTDPRMLPCLHTFCLKCLICTGENSQETSGDKLPCPLCRKEFTIPKEGMTGLQKNFPMESFIEFKTMLQTSSTSCHMCNNESKTGNKSDATMRCLECKENYCDSCTKVHQKQKVNIDHRIVKIEKETDEDTVRMTSVETCTKHAQKPLDFYCADCKKVVCAYCFAERHKLHDCKVVAIVDKEFRQTIEKHLWKISIYADEMLSMRKNAEKRKADFLKEIVEKEMAIQKRSEELKYMINEQTKRLLEDLSVAKSNHLMEIEKEMEEIDRSWTMLRSFQVHCTELRSKRSASDICSSIDELFVTAHELEKDHQAFIVRLRQSVEVSFESTNIQEFSGKSDRNVMGNIKVKTGTISQFESNTILVGLSDGPTITNGVLQINLRRPNEISIQEQIPTTMRRLATAGVYCNTMYVTGIGDNNDEIWKYNMASGWIQCASLIQGRRRHSAAFIEEILYICGGYSDSGQKALDSVEAYNEVTDRCRTVGKLFHVVEASGNCVAFRSSLYIFGGRGKYNNALDDVQVYDTKLDTCTLLSTPMPCPYFLMRAAVWKTSVILVGNRTCFIFNFETETWQERRHFKTEVIHFGLVLENERLFVIGGGINKTDTEGKVKWKCRDDVRYVPLRNFLEDKPIEWKIHAKLPQPSLIQAYETLTCFVP